MIKEVSKKELIEFIEFIDKSNNNPFRRYFIYTELTEIMGYLIIDKIYDQIEIINIYIKEKYRNKKIASKLIENLIQIAKENKIINITLEVNEKNIFALNLYKKYNFKEVAIRKQYYDLDDGLLMELKL